MAVRVDIEKAQRWILATGKDGSTFLQKANKHNEELVPPEEKAKANGAWGNDVTQEQEERPFED